MSNVILAVNVVAPLFIFMSLGVVGRKTSLLNDALVRGVNRVIFYMFLPVLLFVNIYQTDMENVFNANFAILIFLITMAVVLLTYKIVPIFERDNFKRGVVIQGMIRGNAAYFGIPVVSTLGGDEYTGLMAMAIAIVAILYNFSSVVIFERFSNEKKKYEETLKKVAQNPMILGTLAGLFFVIADIKVPDLIMDVLISVAGVASPLALINLGGSFVLSHSAKYIKQLTATILVKLVIVPAIVIPLTIVAGFSATEIAVLFAVISAPTAVASFAMAQNMRGDDVLAGQIVVYSSAASLVTLFVGIIIFGPYMI